MITPEIEGKDAAINIKFATFRCQDEGLYTCQVDEDHPIVDAEAVVTSKYLLFITFFFSVFFFTNINFDF